MLMMCCTSCANYYIGVSLATEGVEENTCNEKYCPESVYIIYSYTVFLCLLFTFKLVKFLNDMHSNRNTAVMIILETLISL